MGAEGGVRIDWMRCFCLDLAKEILQMFCFALFCSALRRIYLHLLSDWVYLHDLPRRSWPRRSFFLEGVTAELHVGRRGN